jgi:Right handed beta helix region
MRNIQFAARATIVASLSLVAMSPDAAQRTYVASYGSDANNCSLAAPCRAFNAALTNTDIGGEIVVLDSAGYGKAVVDHTVAIIAPPGVYAGITVSSGSGIFVAGSGINVTLQGLTINGIGGGSVGVDFYQGARLLVDRCVISGLEIGIQTNAGQTTIIDTTIHDHTQRGVFVGNGSKAVHLDRVRLQRNGSNGLYVFLTNPGNSRVSMRDSVITDSGHEGVLVHSSSGAFPAVDIESSEITSNGWAVASPGALLYVASGSIGEVTIARSLIARNNGDGVRVQEGGGSARMSVSDSTITGNYGNGIYSDGTTLATRNIVTLNQIFGFDNFNGTFLSGGDNRAFSNFAGPTSGTISSAPNI